MQFLIYFFFGGVSWGLFNLYTLLNKCFFLTEISLITIEYCFQYVIFAIYKCLKGETKVKCLGSPLLISSCLY